VQVLGEFYRVVTARVRPPLTATEAMAQVAVLARAWPPATYQLSYWDAQLWATARLNQTETVVSRAVHA
jgi:hypothetical protein